jgi:two-component system, NtrC family, response regulator AtoC
MAENAVETPRVLVVSREMALLRPLWSMGESNSWHLETAASGWEAMERMQSDIAPHMLLLDLPKGNGDSLHLLRWLRRLRPDLPVIVVCHPEDASKQNEATRLGAEEVLVRPFDEDRLERAIRRHLMAPTENLEAEIVSDDIEVLDNDESFLSISPVMQKLRAQAALLAQADVPVLILGEPGSGKGTVARLIHKLSINSGFVFQKVNCATMPGHLLEVELFGRANDESGVSGSRKINPGKLELSEKGTLLIEEITEMPMNLQTRLLQVLQDKQLGNSGEPGLVGARILATSSAKLDRALAEKRLREDLYYRLSAFTVHVPPLRQRKEEIKVLLQYFMHKVARYYGLAPREFTPSALEGCVNHSWPRNMEELETFVKRYLVAGDEEIMLGGQNHNPESRGDGLHTTQTFEPSGPVDVEVKSGAASAVPQSLKSLIQSVKSEAERNAIAAALEKTGWNRKAAARLLKVSYRTLLYKIEHYHMSAAQPYVVPFMESRFVGLGIAAKRSGKAS